MSTVTTGTDLGSFLGTLLKNTFFISDILFISLAVIAIVNFAKRLRTERFLKNLSRTGMIVFFILILSECANYAIAMSENHCLYPVDRQAFHTDHDGFSLVYMIKAKGSLWALSYDYDIEITQEEYESLKDGDEVLLIGNESLEHLKERYSLKVTADIGLTMLFLLLFVICVLNDKREKEMTENENSKDALP